MVAVAALGPVSRVHFSKTRPDWHCNCCWWRTSQYPAPCGQAEAKELAHHRKCPVRPEVRIPSVKTKDRHQICKGNNMETGKSQDKIGVILNAVKPWWNTRNHNLCDAKSFLGNYLHTLSSKCISSNFELETTWSDNCQLIALESESKLPPEASCFLYNYQVFDGRTHATEEPADARFLKRCFLYNYQVFNGRTRATEEPGDERFLKIRE